MSMVLGRAGGADQSSISAYFLTKAGATRTRGYHYPAEEESMTTLKNLMIVGALLVGAGPFCATANELPDASAVDRQVAATPGPATARHYGHRMYMMTVNRTHKGSKLTPTSNAKPQVKQ